MEAGNFLILSFLFYKKLVVPPSVCVEFYPIFCIFALKFLPHEMPFLSKSDTFRHVESIYIF